MAQLGEYKIGPLVELKSELLGTCISMQLCQSMPHPEGTVDPLLAGSERVLKVGLEHPE